MALHFTREEFDEPGGAGGVAARGLDALLMFKQESMYWLTGYDTFGYCFFQCLVLRADGDLVLLTRAPICARREHTSIIEDIRIWVDREGSDPAAELRALLAEKALPASALGVEYDTHGLTAANGRRLDAALDGFADDDRRVGSDRPAAPGEVPGRARLRAPRRRARRRRARRRDRGNQGGADEGAILAAMHAAIFRGGGDYPGNPFIIGSGRDALLCRYKSGRRRLDASDQLTLEFAGVYPPVPRLPDAHAPGRRAKRTAARCTPPAARRYWPARRGSSPARPWARCSMPMPRCSTVTACARTG